MKTLIIAASNGSESLSGKFARIFKQFLPEADMLDLSNPEAISLPWAGTGDHSLNGNVKLVKDTFEASQNIVIIAPEYNWGLSAGCKNLFDLLSATPAIWSGKVFMCNGCSAGRGGRMPIVELWVIINKIIAFSHASSIVSPYNLELQATSLDEQGQLNVNFSEILQRALNAHNNIARCFLNGAN